jgi:hypothetical protein
MPQFLHQNNSPTNSITQIYLLLKPMKR